MHSDPIELFESEFNDEKTFFGVAKKSIRIFWNGKKRGWVFYFLVLLVCFFIGYLVYYSPNSTATLEKITSLMMQVEGGLLGFLIAGFAIYAAISNLDLLYLLTSYEDKKSGMSQFHVNYLVFFEPFVFLGISFSLSVAGYFIALIWPQLSSYQAVVNCNAVGFIVVPFVGVYLYLIFLSIVSIKDFVYNVYVIGILLGRFLVYQKSKDMPIDELANELRKMRGKKKV